MRILNYIVFFALISCSKVSHMDLPLSNKIIIPKTYVVNKTESNIIIDGKDNDWYNSDYTVDFIDIEGDKIPSQKTNTKMLWDDDNLYIFAKLYEEHIWGDITTRDSTMFLNNDFEVFITPNDHVNSYGEFEINALGTEWDLFLNKPYRLGGRADSSWNIEGLKSAVSIDGTINNPNDIDNFWTVEIAIPLNQISLLKDPYLENDVKAGTVWRINFSRVNWEFDLINDKYFRKKVDGKFLPEYNWVWSPQGKINMHIPENWGYLVFDDGSLMSDISLGTELELEHTLYAIFREIRFGSFKKLLDLENGSEVKFKAEKFNGKNIYSSFIKNDNGFKIFANYGVGVLNYSIDHTGLIKRN